MVFSGIQKFTMLDYPERCACIVFTPGCNMRCGYCYNSEFVLPEKVCKLKDSFIPEDAVIRFLERRRGLLDGVVISGGEPTLHPGLVLFAQKVKSLGFAVKLDTNGTRYDVVRELVEKKSVDYIAMDLKHVITQYRKITPVSEDDICNIKKTITFLLEEHVPYEFRTTLIKGLHQIQDIHAMLEHIQGAQRYFYQQYRVSETLLNAEYKRYEAYSVDEMERFATVAAQYASHVGVRY